MRKTKTKEKRIKITIQSLASNTFIPSRYFLQRWVNKALVKHVGSNEVNIRLVSKKESAKLNSTYRHKNGPTNILSFPFEPPPEVSSPLLGDLVICAALVNQQAKQQTKTRLAHWAHLVIHGCLHLVGYDHIHDKDAIKMETLEIQLLKDLGYENPYI
ncbi:rRNA maturation RNase YbeY [Rickettsiella endosymbiont of Miltochrista miniata]|uniref:rRNA maturation RNase YbeY n=1 Tax=Rickettsiella endosymbiont of Miltochrista miniata TaxID=3066239 RepID=UPI00313BD6A4